MTNSASPKRILITGSNGLLGQKLVALLSRGTDYDLLLTSKHESSFFDELDVPYRQLDITTRNDVRRVVDEFQPDTIINTAAVTNVDLCETERKLAWSVNVAGVENLAIAAKFAGAKIIHLSTDYVFDGKNGPYNEEARPNPLSYYGRTKLASENVVRTSGVPFAIVRTMILYGVANNVKPNFVLWLIHELEREKPVRVVDDQYGSPTLVDDLAYGILKIITFNREGVYHIAGPEWINRYEFAVKLAKTFSFDKKLIAPVKTLLLKQPAPRPLRSGLITLKAETQLGIKMSNTDQGLMIVKNQLNLTVKRFVDAAPIPGRHR
jgi:dTDP-4-dehydrorhamnose reductase